MTYLVRSHRSSAPFRSVKPMVPPLLLASRLTVCSRAWSVGTHRAFESPAVSSQPRTQGVIDSIRVQVEVSITFCPEQSEHDVCRVHEVIPEFECRRLGSAHCLELPLSITPDVSRLSIVSGKVLVLDPEGVLQVCVSVVSLSWDKASSTSLIPLTTLFNCLL